MLKTYGILHFTLGVRDIARSVAFYRDVVGLEIVKINGDQMAFLRSGKDQLVLVRQDDVNASATPDTLHQAFLVEPRDFEDGVRFLESRGIEIINRDERKGPDTTFAGRSVYFRDPDGNALEMIDLRAATFRPSPEKP